MNNDFYEYMENEDIKVKINAALDTIPPREKQMIEMHYGLNGYSPMKKADIARHFNLSDSRVRQIIEKGKRRLRHRARKLANIV